MQITCLDHREVRLPTMQMKPSLMKSRQLGSVSFRPMLSPAGYPCQAAAGVDDAGSDEASEEEDEAGQAPPCKKARRTKTRRVSRF